VTLRLIALLAAAAVGATALAGLYVVWPRRPTAIEWLSHSRQRARTSEARSTSLSTAWLAEVQVPDTWRRLEIALKADLSLVRLADPRQPATPTQLAAQLTRYGAIGLAAGLAATLALGTGRDIVTTPLLLIVAIALPLALVWLRLRRRASNIRTAVRLRVPHLLTAARVLLESGAATPAGALSEASAAHTDVVSLLMQEALRRHEVQQSSLPQAIEDVADRYGLLTLRQLADTLRVGTRYGTRMADLLASHSQQLRDSWRHDYRERMTRAPVLMTLPALIFFVLPFLALVLIVVFAPLLRATEHL
jgi:Flp pilus assembly protein TadB